MRFLLFFCVLFHCNFLKAEVYDCFTFFNELELLRLRFEELYNVVDRFVIVESPISYTGKEKPLYYRENAHLFQQFQDKVIHIVVDSFPGLTDDEEKNHWAREAYSRNAISLGLQNCKDNDVIFISDLDEIPRAETIREVQDYLARFADIPERRRAKLNDSDLVCGLDMRLFMYSMNRENPKGWYGGSKGAPYWIVQKHTPWGIKLFHHKYAMHKIPNAGWHFNTMGGKEKSLYKWLHTGPIYFPGLEKALLELGERPELLAESYKGHVDYNTVIVPIDPTYPKYFLDHIDYFREIGWLDEEK